MMQHRRSSTVMHYLGCMTTALRDAPLRCNTSCTPVGATKDYLGKYYLSLHARPCKKDQIPLPQLDYVVAQIGDTAVTNRPRARGLEHIPDEPSSPTNC
jgi:hypothetical protein